MTKFLRSFALISKVSLNFFFTAMCLVKGINAYAESKAVSNDATEINKPEPLRADLTQNKVLLSLGEFSSSSVGIPFSSNSPDEFERIMRDTFARGEVAKYTNSTLWVLGTAIQDERKTLNNFYSKIELLGLASKGVKVRVLSVPKRLLGEQSTSFAIDALESTLYALPSMKRDYQKPQRSEVIGGLMTAALIETPTFIFLFSHLDPMSAALTASTHAILLTGLNIYSKTMLNWLLRPGFQNKRLQEFEIFVKQMIIPIPFVLNFNVFGKYPQVHDFLTQNNWPTILSAFATETLQFGSNHGLTLALQAVFYSQVIVKGIGKWVAGQSTEANARDARTVRPWLELTPLSINAVLFAMAASNWGGSYINIGYVHLNAGELGLIAITTLAGTILQKFPQLLDPAIPIFRNSVKLKNYFLTRFRKGEFVSEDLLFNPRCADLLSSSPSR